jgi:hypothetical protein
VVDGNGTPTTNYNWKSDQQAKVTATGVAIVEV